MSLCERGVSARWRPRGRRSGGRWPARNADWGFAIAYDAVLQASRAFMFAQGYRPASKESHKNVFAFMREALGEDFAGLIGYFDRIRTKRHRAIYDVAGLITETEAKNLFAKAQDFVKLIGERLR